MSRHIANRAAFVVILVICAAVTSLSVATTAVAQSPAETSDESSQAENTPVAPRLPRQPGDDVAKPLESGKQVPDEKKAEAQASYMAGVAAQKKGNFTEALKAFEQASKADPTAAEPVRARALLLMRLGRIRQAEETARKAVELDPDDFETRLQLAILVSSGGGRRADRSAAVAQALQLIEEALQSKRLDKKSMDLVRIHSIRGRLFIEAGNASRAAESYYVLLDALEQPEEYGIDFRQHQALMNDRVTGYETIGRIMLEIGRYDRAVAAFSALARINENTPGDYHYLLALAQFRKDDVEAAEENLNRYFETNRRSRESLQLLSDLFNATSRSPDIVDRLSQLAKDNNEADNVNMFLGDLLIEKGNGDEAAAVYQNIIDNSGNADAYIGLIRVDILKRDTASLLKSVSKALRARIQRQELIPLVALIVNDAAFGEEVVTAALEALKNTASDQNPSATYFFSQIAERLELPEPEGTLLKATLKQNPAPALGVEVLERLGLNLYARNEFADASATFRKLLSLPGLAARDRLMTLYRLAIAESRLENYDTAITAIQTALELSPQNPLLSYQLGLIQLQAEKYEDSEKTLKATIQYAESNPELEADTRNLLGGLYSQMGRWDDAIAAYQELLNMPNITDEAVRRGRMSLSNAYVQKGDLPNGEKILEEVYKQDPDDPGVNNDLGYLYADQNKNLEKAESMIRIAVEAEPDNPAYLDSLGWVLYRLGKYQAALEALKKATADPEYRDSTILDHLGDVQKALKKEDDAVKSWKEALSVETESVSPNNELIQQLKEKLGGADDEKSAAENASENQEPSE